MVEWLGLALVAAFALFMCGLIIVSWNIAKGGVDIMQFFSSQRGTVRGGANHITGMGATREKKENPKWGQDGDVK